MIMKVIKKEIIKKTPLAMVICEAVYSDQGLPVDYRTLDANELFEKNLGLKKADIRLNRKILSEIAVNEPLAFKQIVKEVQAVENKNNK